MANLFFPGSTVLELLLHARAAPEHTAGYLDNPKPGPGLLFVKDDGIYLMSNGSPAQLVEDGATRRKVVYANGYEPPKSPQGDFSDSQYNKIRDAGGGDDFVEFLEASIFEALKGDGSVKISLTSSQMAISVQGPK